MVDCKGIDAALRGLTRWRRSRWLGRMPGRVPALVLGLAAVLPALMTVAPQPPAAMGVRTADAPGNAAQEAPYVPDEVLVTFREGLSGEARTALLAGLGLRVKRPAGAGGTYLLTITDGSTVPEAVARLQARPEVASAEPNRLTTLHPLPGSPKVMK